MEEVPVASVAALSLGDFSKNISYPLWLHPRATRALGLGVLSSRERVLPPRALQRPRAVPREMLQDKSRLLPASIPRQAGAGAPVKRNLAAQGLPGAQQAAASSLRDTEPGPAAQNAQTFVQLLPAAAVLFILQEAGTK